VVVQGFGNVGFHAAQFLSEDGCKVVAVIERDGAVFNSDGLDVVALKLHFTTSGGVRGFPNAEFSTDREKALQTECEILVPAALEGAIHAGNAELLRTRLIVEGANGPVTYEADQVLRQRGVVIVPDLFANAGGVTVSYFEWVKNITHLPFGLMERPIAAHDGELAVGFASELGTALSQVSAPRTAATNSEIDLVRSGLERKMRVTYQQMSALWNSKPEVGDLRTAAYVIALTRIRDVYEAVGL
jgi:glutamate dehydrogenase (NAD(P)+)